MFPKLPKQRLALIIFVGLLFVVVFFFWLKFFPQQIDSSKQQSGQNILSKMFNDISGVTNRVSGSIEKYTQEKATELYVLKSAQKSLADKVSQEINYSTFSKYNNEDVNFSYPVAWSVSANLVGDQLTISDKQSTSSKPIFVIDFQALPKKTNLLTWSKKQFFPEARPEQLGQIEIPLTEEATTTATVFNNQNVSDAQQITVIPLLTKVAIVKVNLPIAQWQKISPFLTNVIKSFRLP